MLSKKRNVQNKLSDKLSADKVIENVCNFKKKTKIS